MYISLGTIIQICPKNVERNEKIEQLSSTVP
jgi:hypothetical protein